MKNWLQIFIWLIEKVLQAYLRKHLKITRAERLEKVISKLSTIKTPRMITFHKHFSTHGCTSILIVFLVINCLSLLSEILNTQNKSFYFITRNSS